MNETGGRGNALFIDKFGNIVSNIKGTDLHGDTIRVEINGSSINGLATSYSKSRGLIALVGSHGYLEIARHNGNAAQTLGTTVGDEIRVSTL